MSYQFSEFGRHLGGDSGISDLMVDLGNALATGGPDLKMLGGGQPARIQEVNEVWRRRMEEILEEDGGLDRAITSYDPPRGNPRFLNAVAAMCRDTFGWQVGQEHVAVTTGGQTAFFFLFNLLAGRMAADGTRRRVLLPLVPEYIGYANQGIDGDLFHAVPPRIVESGDHEFKYRVDFDNLEITPDIAAICVSRPTNPTGNVLTDGEIRSLAGIAREHGIPLIIDNAYGVPFPGIIFHDATPYWDDNTILTLSLSKIGLPGTRTGIVIGPPQIIRALGSMSAIAGLSNPSTGQQIILPLIESGEILSISDEIVRPYYERKAALAREEAVRAFDEAGAGDWRMHVTEGALFLWLWFPGLPCSSAELYQRLKAREVLVIPGHYFFFGLPDTPDWPHRHECIRVSYAMEESDVRDGLRVIAREVAAIRAAS